ncbi:hypothetical protein GCM10020219_076920 [Nonomuraea dietziae]
MRLDPGEDVGNLHHVEPLDDPVETGPPGDQPRLCERGDAEHLAHGDAMDDRSGARQADGGLHEAIVTDEGVCQEEPTF